MFDLLMSTPFTSRGMHMPFNFKFVMRGTQTVLDLEGSNLMYMSPSSQSAILPISELNKTLCYLVVFQLKLDTEYKENYTYKCNSIKVFYSVLI